MLRQPLAAAVTAAALAIPGPILPWATAATWHLPGRPEEIVAASLRLTVILLGSGHLAAAGIRAVGRRPRAARAAVTLMLVATAAVPASAGVRIPVVPPSAQGFTPTRPPGPSVVVREGDSMWRIAERRADHDTPAYWRRIVTMNSGRFADVDLIHPGERVLVPPVTPPG